MTVRERVMFTIEATRNYGVPRLIHYCISGAGRGEGGVERASYRSHDNSGGGGGVRVRGRITSLLPQNNNNTATAAERAAPGTTLDTHSQHYYKDEDS